MNIGEAVQTDKGQLVAIAREAWDNAIATSSCVRVADVAEDVIDANPDLVEAIAHQAALSMVMKMLRGFARRESEEDGQLSLFGFPRVLAIPAEGDHLYMDAGRATYPDLEAARETRAVNVERALAKLDSFDASLRTVRPLMEGTTLTLAEAAAIREGE